MYSKFPETEQCQVPYWETRSTLLTGVHQWYRNCFICAYVVPTLVNDCGCKEVCARHFLFAQQETPPSVMSGSSCRSLSSSAIWRCSSCLQVS